MSDCYFCVNSDEFRKPLIRLDINEVLGAISMCYLCTDKPKSSIKCSNDEACLNLRMKVMDFVEDQLPNIDLVLKSINYRILHFGLFRDTSDIICKAIERYKPDARLEELAGFISDYLEREKYGYSCTNFIGFVSIILGLKFCMCDNVEDMIKRKNIGEILEALVEICSMDDCYYYCRKCKKMLCDFIARIKNIHYLDSLTVDRENDDERMNRLIKRRLDIMPIVIPFDKYEVFYKLVKLYTESKKTDHGKRYKDYYFETFLNIIYINAGLPHHDKPNRDDDDEDEFIMKIENSLKQNNCNECLKILETTMYFKLEHYFHPYSREVREKLWNFIMFIPDIYKIDSIKSADSLEDVLYDLLESSFDNNVPKLYDSKNLVNIVEGYINSRYDDVNLSFADFVSSILMIQYKAESLGDVKKHFDSLKSSLKRPLEKGHLDDIEPKKFC